MPTYNHEKYIGRALDSVINQKTNFPFEIIVGEDCSTDNTKNIVLSYAQKYSNIIVLNRHVNLGMRSNLNDLLMACKRKYVAKLEGDDYWTDCGKLQKQIDFLEENDDFVACAHNVHIVDENDEIRSDMPDHYWSDYIFTIHDYDSGKEVLGGHTASLVYRNIFLNMDPYRLKLFLECPINEDQRLNLYLALEGKKMIFSDYMANWMVTKAGNNWTNRIQNKKFSFERYRIDSYSQLEILAKQAYDYNLNLDRGKADVLTYMILQQLKNPSLEGLEILLEYCKKVKLQSVVSVLFEKIKHKLSRGSYQV